MKSIINFLIFIYSIVKVFSNEFRKLAEQKENRVVFYNIIASNSTINFGGVNLKLDSTRSTISYGDENCNKSETQNLCNISITFNNGKNSFICHDFIVYKENNKDGIFGLGPIKTKNYTKNSILPIYVYKTKNITDSQLITLTNNVNKEKISDQYKMFIGNKSSTNLVKSSTDGSWTMKLNSLHFGTKAHDISDYVKYKDRRILINSSLIEFKEDSKMSDFSIFPMEYKSKIFEYLQNNYSETCTLDDDSYMNCKNNVSMYIVNNTNAYLIPFEALRIGNTSNTSKLNIKFLNGTNNTFTFKLNILSALIRVYDVENNTFGISPGEGIDPVDLNEPTFKETIITIIIITIIVIVITIIVMQLMKKDSNDAVDYNNMQQI